MNREARKIRAQSNSAKYTATNRQKQRKRVDDLERANAAMDRPLRAFEDRAIDARQGHPPVIYQYASSGNLPIRLVVLQKPQDQASIFLS